MTLAKYDYLMGIGTCFALLDAYNNGANDVANSWATSVSSRSISYRWAMVLGTIFEFVGAVAVGARTASTIKNGIIPVSALQNNAGVQMLAFTCALAAASSWVMWCTRNSVHVSSSYSLISAVAGVGVATIGANQVQWGWNNGNGLGAIFAGLLIAPIGSGAFAATIFMMIKLLVHMRKNPVPWAVWSSPFFFLVAGTICTLSIVYKGSPTLGLNKKPAWYIAAVTLGVGGGLFVLSAIFFVPWLHAKVVKRDASIKWWMIIMGPLLWKRVAPTDAADAVVPNYAVVQKDPEDEEFEKSITNGSPELVGENGEKTVTPTKNDADIEVVRKPYAELMAEARERFHAKLRRKPGPLGWAMRFLKDHPMGEGRIYEFKNLGTFLSRIPAYIIVAALYGMNYDIHAAQVGVEGTPEGARMARTYAMAEKYPNEVEHTYSFIQIITACTASFAHGSNDIGNSVGPWAVIYYCWTTGQAAGSSADVPIWQIAVLALTLSVGLITYGFNIMRVMGNKITYHSPSRGSSMEMGAAIVVLLFSQYSLPVSTSMCITGATVGVGLCNGKFRAVNWHRVGLLVFSWIMTIPIAGTIAGCLMGIIINAPHFGSV